MLEIKSGVPFTRQVSCPLYYFSGPWNEYFLLYMLMPKINTAFGITTLRNYSLTFCIPFSFNFSIGMKEI